MVSSSRCLATKTINDNIHPGAPECYRFDRSLEDMRIDVRQNVDIWSLGCVLSEVAVWVVGGPAYLQSYRQERKQETDKIPGFRDGDCFHNGEEVLSSVTAKHCKLPGSIRRGDYITEPILQHLDRSVLIGGEGRLDARQLAYIA